MQLGMIGLGRMGANMVRRLVKGWPSMRGLRQVAESRRGASQGEGDRQLLARGSRLKAAKPASDLADGPGGDCGANDRRPTATTLDANDILIDGGNSYYVDDIRRAKELPGEDRSTMWTWERAAASGAWNAAIA